MKNIVVIDSFYKNPQDVRELALNCEWIKKRTLPKYFPGTESLQSYFNKDLINKMETAIGKKVIAEPENSSFGIFAKASDQDKGKNPVHTDHTEWAGIVYLSKHEKGGTNFYKNKYTNWVAIPEKNKLNEMGFKDRHEYREKQVVPIQYDSDQWELNAKVGMKFNRMVLFRAGRLFHSADCYYGSEPEDERLIQLFFFNTEEVSSE